MLRVLVVEDSDVVRELLVELLRKEAHIQVVGEAVDGAQGVERASALRPDVVVMDVNLPKLDGLEATRRIMRTAPCPVILVSSSYDPEDVERSFDALAAGAVALTRKPGGVRSPSFERLAREFIETVKLMAEVRVITRSKSGSSVRLSDQPRSIPKMQPIEVVAIAASTGGPAALKALLGGLPRSFPLPILVVQHLAVGFHDGFVEWLDGTVPLTVRMPVQGAALEPGVAFIAPPEVHLRVGAGPRVRLDRSAPIKGHRPSASPLFASVAEAFGAAGLAVVLTGMGDDGVDGLADVKAAGGTVLAQDAATSVVYGMPKEAERLGLVDRSLALNAIAPAVIALVGEREPSSRPKGDEAR